MNVFRANSEYVVCPRAEVFDLIPVALAALRDDVPMFVFGCGHLDGVGKHLVAIDDFGMLPYQCQRIVRDVNCLRL